MFDRKVLATNIIPFVSNYKVVYNYVVIRKPWLRAVNEAVLELLGRRDIKKDELHHWAYYNIVNLPERVNEIPHWVYGFLQHNKDSFEKLAMVTIKEFMVPNKSLPSISRSELTPEQHEILKKCKTKEEGLYGYCLSCYSPRVYEEHPFFVSHICNSCLDDLKNVIKCQKTFPSLTYCTVCADTMRDSVFCSNDRCAKWYCRKCIKYLSGTVTVENLMNTNRFICFLCTDEVNKNIFGMLTPRFDFKNKVENLFRENTFSLVDPPVLKKPLTVLSIEDSFQIGLKCLKELNIPVQMYYVVDSISAVSNDKDVKDLGNLIDLTASTFEKIGPIDLVIIGSPSSCDSNNMRIGGVHEFFRVLNLIKTFCSLEFFWFFETVASVDVDFKIMVDRFLQCKPVKINNSEERWFWGNLISLSSMESIDFHVADGCTSTPIKRSTSESEDEDGRQLSAKEDIVIRKSHWDVELLKELFGFLSDFYHK